MGSGAADATQTGDPGDAAQTVDAAESTQATDPGDATQPADAGDAAQTADPPGSAEAVDPADAVTDEDLLAQVQWLLGLLEPDAVGPDPASAEEHFAPVFLDAVDGMQLLMVFAQVRAAGPYVVTGASQEEGVGRTAQLQLEGGDEAQIMSVSVDDDGLIEGLFFQPDTSGEVPQISAWAELDEALAEVGGTSQVVVGQVRDGRCEVLHTTEGVQPGGDPAPSGSVYKLLVLSAVVDAVADGALSWEEELTITEEVQSLPSGVLQDREPGTTVSVREAAGLMISISDNTATDLLVEEVGQDLLSAAAEQAGVQADRVNPVATTKQFFVLGWQVDQEVRDRWAAAGSPAERDEILAELPTDLDLEPMAVTEPRWQDDVDFLLTGAEICGVHARLQAQGATGAGAPVREILAENPGLPVPEGTSYQGFKGGSAPGVLALALYLEPDGAAQGEGMVLVTQTRSEQDVDQLRAATLVEGGLRHLVRAED